MAFPTESSPTDPGRHAWIESLIRPNLRPYSERAPLALQSVGRLLERLGDPHARLRCVHIAGSKGKGATALLAEALLESLGLRTGTFTSPHLERWTERFRVNGAEISRAELDQAADHVRPHVDALSAAHPDNPPSFFDVLTAMALWMFERRGVDIAVIETGIGGRYDATNIVRPEVACITNVELEHTDKLGANLAAIAGHKAGILKPGAAAVLGSFADEAEDVIRAEAKAAGCEAAWLGRDFAIARADENDPPGLAYRSAGASFDFELALPGKHMAENAALAIACAQRIRGVDGAMLAQAAGALGRAALPGRIEILRQRPWWVVDAAHTERSVAALAAALDALPAADRHFVVSLSAGKPAALLAPLLDRAVSVAVTSPEPLRSAPAVELASAISARYPEKEVLIHDDVSSALKRAASRLGPNSLLCAAGSTYIAGAARRILLSWADPAAPGALPDRRSSTVRARGGRAPTSANPPEQEVSERPANEGARSA